jgi:hypothetical protein
VYAAGRLVRAVSIVMVNDEPQQFRLPTGVKERMWEVEFLVAANSEVREFYLAGSALELKNA